MMATFGFIGTGNMGGALARAARKKLDGKHILLANRTAAKAEALAADLDCQSTDNATVAEKADFIFLGVKPYMVAGLMADIAPVLEKRKDRFVLVSMAAALTIPDLRQRGCGDYPLIRIMPNTPSAVGEGVIFYDLKRLNIGMHNGDTGTNAPPMAQLSTDGRAPWWNCVFPLNAVQQNKALAGKNNPNPTQTVKSVK